MIHPLASDKKVLINLPDLNVPGGVTNYFNVLRLPEYGHIDYFFVNQSTSQNLLVKSIWLLSLYIKFIGKARQYDLIHLNVSLNFKSYYRDMGFILLSQLLGRKYLVFFHGWEFDFEERIKQSRWRRRLFQATYGKMNACIVLGTMYQKKVAALGLPPDCQVYLETTVAEDLFINELDVASKLDQNQTLNILFLARILASKGIYIALDAFQMLQKKRSGSAHVGPALQFLVAGDGPELSNVKAYVREQKIEGVSFCGYVLHREKHQVLADSHIFLFPTCYPEGQPSVNLEAMLYGMPVITRTVAGIPDIVEHRVNGFLTDSTEAHVFAEFLEELVKDQSLRQAIGARNHQLALEKFVPQQIVPRVLKIYQDTIQ